MPGLSIPVGGGRVLGTPNFAQSSPATIAQTAYGAQSAPVQGGGGIETGHVVMGAAAASVLFLAFVRHSLPAGQRSTFDLVATMALPGLVIYGAAGIWARRRLRYDAAAGIPHGAALFVKAVTP